VNQTPPGLIIFVVRAIAALAFVGLGSLCASMFLHTYADPAIMTAIITLTGGLVGSLGTILSSPRSVMTTSTTTTDSDGGTTTTTQPIVLAPIAPVIPDSPEPTPVIVKQPENEPVPTVSTTPSGE
jgi:hypothetical protein